jgi:hypothetical protein
MYCQVDNVNNTVYTHAMITIRLNFLNSIVTMTKPLALVVLLRIVKQYLFKWYILYPALLCSPAESHISFAASYHCCQQQCSTAKSLGVLCFVQTRHPTPAQTVTVDSNSQ